MNEPEWVASEVVLAIHDAQLVEHGGSEGIRDLGLLDSALARPQNVYAYSTGATLPQLAAAYAVGITQKHPFIDGNKRTAWVVCALFLELNGIHVIAPQENVVEMMLGLAGSTVAEEEFALWLADQR